MILSYEGLIADCISASLQGDYERAEKICYEDLPSMVNVEFLRGTEDAVSEGTKAENRMKEVIDSFFPE